MRLALIHRHRFFLMAVSHVICLATLFWVTTVAAYTNAADNEANSDPSDRTTKPESEIEAGSAEKSEPDEPESIEIPLDKIWALDMPGTRDIYEMDGDGSGEESQDIQRVNKARQRQLALLQRTLATRQPDQKAMAGFAVIASESRSGLTFAVAGIRKKGPLGGNTLPATGEIRVVFFSYTSAYRVELEKAERRGTAIDIRYRFVPQYSVESTVHFALIPLGELPPGDYRVQFTQSPMEKKYLDAGFKPVSDDDASRIVSQPFSFTIYEPPAPDRGPDKDAIVIPLDQIWGHDRHIRGLRRLEPDLLLRLDTPEKIAKYTTPEGIGERRRKSAQSLVLPIEAAMRKMPYGKDAKVAPGFAVRGRDRATLLDLHNVFAMGNKPRERFVAGTEISIVFFTPLTGLTVRLDRVLRKGNKIEIHYMLLTGGHTYLRWNLALVPCGQLPSGTYRVELTRSPEKEKDVYERSVRAPEERLVRPAERGIEKRIVCQPFSFSVGDIEQKD